MLMSLRVIFFCFYAPIIICSVVLLLSFANRPALSVPYTLDAKEVKQVKAIFHHLRSSDDKLKTLALTQKNLNNLLNYFLNRYFESAIQVTLAQNSLYFKAALRLPENNFGAYLNLKFKLVHDDNLFHIQSLQFGRIVIADEFSELFLKLIINYSPLKDVYLMVKDTLRSIAIKPDNLTLGYRFESQSNQQTTLLTADQQTLWFYQQKIAQIIDKHDPAWRLSLAQLLQPLFEVAFQRSTLETAINENKIVIIAVSRYVNKSELQRYWPFHNSVNNKRQYAAFLYKRMDMAQHFMTSALLTTMGSGALAIMLGQEKELRDAKQGSGFSFIDLAGDRAGIRFGKMATASPESARRLQKVMAKIEDYRAFMPEVRDLPENISDKIFKDKFGSIYSPAYQEMLKKIDMRIAALPIYQL
ncbi:MAG: hypothetical protein GQ569_08880 [Methylococcaceae bacterium]|nr:hypothetical protein [Methylococcaceae bacterium]